MLNQKILPAFFLLALLCFVPAPVQARIDIVPQKIVISPRERSTEITILNMFDRPGTFRVEAINYRQDEDGRYTDSEGSVTPPFDVTQHVRYSPRQFTLPPGGRQKIRLSLRKPADLPDGEYRFHVKTVRFGEPPAPDENAPDTDEEPEQRVKLTMNMGVTIPVIIRHGQTDASASLSDIKLIEGSRSESGYPELHTTIERSGNRSAMCIVKVLWAPQGEEEREIGFLRNVNVFTEVNERHLEIKLKESPYGDGTLRIELQDEETLELFDEAILR